MEQCNFCNAKVEKLEISHLIPKFIYKWLKETSTTNRMRSSVNPNKPAQDGYKIPFLCKTCEGNFSKYEKYFAEKVFKPFVDTNNIKIFENIDFNMLDKFISSLIWRIAKHSINDPKMNGKYKNDEIKLFNSYTNEIQENYNLNTKINFNTYFIPLTEEFVKENIFQNIDFVYFERSIAMEFMIFDNYSGVASVIIKFPFMLIVCEYISSSSQKWKGLKINEGKFQYSKEYKIPQYINDFIEFDKKRHYAVMENLSKHKLDEIIKKAANIKETDGTYKAKLKNYKHKIL